MFDYREMHAWHFFGVNKEWDLTFREWPREIRQMANLAISMRDVVNVWPDCHAQYLHGTAFLQSRIVWDDTTRSMFKLVRDQLNGWTRHTPEQFREMDWGEANSRLLTVQNNLQITFPIMSLQSPRKRTAVTLKKMGLRTQWVVILGTISMQRMFRAFRQRRRRTAVCMSQHPRLGWDSPLSRLDPSVFVLILEYV